MLTITTATHPSPDLEDLANQLAQELNGRYAPRRNVTVAQIHRENGMGRLLIVESHRMRLRDGDGSEYFFHPNLVQVRGHNLLRGARDLFAEATGLALGDRLLDCTLGFATEATLGALLVGEQGLVVGLESVPELAAVTRAGVAQFPLQGTQLVAGMRRIRVVNADYRDYLAQCDSGTFDVVYFDPFFDERLPGAENSVSLLAHFGNPAALDVGAVQEARRVARRRVVIKHPKHELLPGELADDVTSVVTTRKKRVQYDILLPFS